MSIISGTGLGRIVPVRDPERELRSSGSGSVTTYTMSPDELEAHFGKTIKPSRGDKGVAQFTLSKEEYLKERMAGKSREEIAQAQNVSLAGLGYWLKKWGIKDSYQEELEIGAAMLPPLKLSETDIQLAERIDLLRRLDEAKEDAASWKQTAEMYRRELEELQFKATDPSKLVDTRFEEIGIQIGQLVGKKKNAAYGDSFAKTGQFLQLLYRMASSLSSTGMHSALCVFSIN